MWVYRLADYGPSGHKSYIDKHVCNFCAKTYDKAVSKFLDDGHYKAYIKAEKQIKKLKNKMK
jgi:hypothetical protein